MVAENSTVGEQRMRRFRFVKYLTLVGITAPEHGGSEQVTQRGRVT